MAVPVLKKIEVEPGVFKDDTPLSVGLHLTDTNTGRFVRRKFQVAGGYETATADAVEGICRGMFGWQINTLPQAAIGTNSYLQIFYDAEIYDATPILEYGTFTNPFTTIITETDVNVNDTAHGRAVGDRVIFANASAVGGLTIDGEYEITEIVDVDNYTIVASSAATSSAGPGGGTVYYSYVLPVGLVDNLGGDGYGVGAYSEGDYSEGASITQFFPRTWSFDNFGPNLVACPRGGGLYEWAPAYSAPELVTNGDFAASAGWTFGTGWSYTGSAAAATLSSAALSQIVLAEDNAYNLVTFDVGGYTTGLLRASLGGTTLATSLAANGHYRYPVYQAGGNTTLAFFGTSLTATIDNVSVKQMLVAQTIPGAPTQNTCVLVTPELICLAGGTIDADTGEFNPMQIRSSDTGDGNLEGLHDWVPTPENLSRRWTLAKGSRIVRLKNGNGVVLAWTDTALYTGTYSTDTNIVYRWQLVAEGCGLIGANAVAVLSGIAYWITPAGEFMMYAGGVPQEMDSTLVRWMKGQLAPSQQDKIYACENTQFGEIDWYIPTVAANNECAIYVRYNTKETLWCNGIRNLTAKLDTGAFGYVLAVSADGALTYEEKGNSADGNPLAYSYTTGAVDIADGNTLMMIMGMVPDFSDLAGGLTVTVYCYLYPASTPVTFGPYSVTSATTKIDFIALGRQCALKVEGNSAPAFMRDGVHRLRIVDSGMLQ